MIVQCEKCRTKFRIADERVSPKGVKVRCSRCAHVFVARHEAPAEPPSFTASGPDTTRLAPSELMSLAARTHPDSPETTGVNPIAPASTEQAALALGFSGSGPRAAIDAAESEAKTVQSRLPSAPPPPPPPGDSADEMPAFPSWATSNTRAGDPDAPTSQLGAPELSGAHGVPPPPPPPGSSDDHFPPPSAPPQPFPQGGLPDLALSSSPFAEPEPTGAGGSRPNAAPSSSPSESGFTSPFTEPTPYRTSEADAASPFAEPSAFEAPSSSPDLALEGASSSPFADPAPSSAPDLELSSTPFAAPLSAPPNPASSPFAAPLDTPGNSADIPGLLPTDALSGDDPFAGEDFVDDAAEPTGASPLVDAIAAPAPVARIDLNQAAAVPNLSEKWSQAETTAIAAAYDDQQVAPPPVQRELPQIGDRGGLWPSLIGALLGAALVLTFLPEVGAGILDTFSRRGGDAIKRVSHQQVLPESLPSLRPIATHVVAYRIASGAEVLVVRGAARNLSADPVAGLSAVALAMDGDTVVARASAPVGVMLDPAVLAQLERPDQVSAAYAQRSGGASQIKIQPGDERPFMVVFPEMPAAAEDLVFVVEFVPFDP